MNRLPRRRWPSFTQPSTLLFSTVTTGILRIAGPPATYLPRHAHQLLGGRPFREVKRAWYR
jgi:hypothetical protein